MKIAHIVHSLNIGGLEKMVSDQILLSLSKDIEYSVICLDEKGAFSKELEEKGYKVACFNREKFDIGLFFRLAYFLRKEKIDIVHTHNPGPLLYGAIAAKLAGVPSVHTKHGTNLRKDIKCNWINRFMMFAPAQVVAVSGDAYKIALNKDKVSKNKLSMFRNGIHIESFMKDIKDRDRLYEKYKVPKSGSLIGIVARLSWEKDIDTLLEAFHLLVKEKEKVRLVIVGDGEERSRLETIVRAKGLSDKVFFLGFQSEIAEILSLFDVFVLSSIREGTSVTLIEAMSSGLPAVVTDVGGNAELIKDGVNGFVVEAGDNIGMKQALLKLIENGALAEEMGKRSQELSKQKYDIQRTIESYEGLYRNKIKLKYSGKSNESSIR